MNQIVEESSDAVHGSLWSRSPQWRVCVCVTVLLSAAAIAFPPAWKTTSVRPATPLPEAIAYRSQVPAEVAPPAPVAPSVPAPVAMTTAAAPSKPQPAAPAPTIKSKPAIVAQAPASISASASASARPSPFTMPRTAAIAMATPGGASPADRTGLDAAFVGRTFQQSVRVNGFDVPLPPGQWAMIANSRVKMRTGATGVEYFLGKIEHRRMIGAARIFALRSNDQPGSGFPAASGCVQGNPNLDHLFIDSVTAGGHEGCWLIDNFFTPPLKQWADRSLRLSPLDRAAAGDLAAKGVDYSQDLINVRFTRAETWGFLEVSYLFDPATDAIHSGEALSFAESDWHATNVQRYPEKVAYLAKTAAWAETFWPRIEQSFDAGKPSDGADVH